MSARNFHVDVNFRYLGFDHSFLCWTKELLFRGGFSKVGGVVTTRWILLGGIVISRQILRVWRIIEAPTCWWRITEAPAYWWRIIEAPTCWLEDYRASCLFGSLCRYFCLLQRAYLIDSSIGIAADFVAGYLGNLCSISLRIFCCRSGEFNENVYFDDDDKCNVFSDE